MKAHEMKLLLRKLANDHEEMKQKSQAEAAKTPMSQYPFLAGAYDYQLKELIKQIRILAQ